jgi:hypothetical protein
MLVHDGIFEWEGFGGMLRLGSGRCRLRIFDLAKDKAKGLSHLRPLIIVATDIPESRMSVRSCVSHIATLVAKQFHIEPQRMLFLEYYPEVTYGRHNENVIPERYDSVEFVWHADKAMHPKWRSVAPPMLDIVKELMASAP